MHTFFTVDLGATSGRTVLARLEDGRMTLTEFSRFENPILPISGHWFWNLPHLYNEILKALGRVAQEGIEIESIGIDTWGCDFSLFGSDGQLLGLPYSYRDPHTDGAQPLFFGKMPSRELYDRTGIQFMNFNSVFQLDTLRRNGSRALDIADKILFTPDALTYMLTGEAVCEYTIASTSQLVDVRKRDLDPEILSILGLRRGQFGRLVQPGTIVGTISPQVQKATGLGPVPVIAVAGHDTASAVAAVPARDRNFAYLSCGTWSLLGIEASEPVVSEESFTLNFTNEGGIDGKIRFLKNICGLWIFEQSRKEFKGVPTDVVSLVKSAETSSCRALIDPDAPVFSHPESMTQAIREYCRATGQEAPETPADYCRCIFRSLAIRCAQMISCLRTFSDHPIDVLHVIGGGSRNAYLMQQISNAARIPVICGPVEGTAMGNALLQARAAGVLDTDIREVSAASTEVRRFTPEEDGEMEEDLRRGL